MIKKIIKKIRYELEFNNTNYYARASDKFFKILYQQILVKKIKQLPPIDVGKPKPLFTLATFANKKRFYESIAALYSFCYWEPNIHIHYHEDGTLTTADIKILKDVFPGIMVFLKQEQVIKSRDFLLSKGLNNCAYVSDNFHFGVKLFDMILEKNTDYLLHIDSDVLFFSRPNEILDVVNTKIYNGCFNRDIADFYTFDTPAIAKYITSPIINGFNSGVLMHNFDESVFEFIDKVMENKLSVITSWHLEQTLLAMLATHKGGFLGLPKQYDILSRQRNQGIKIISEHYTHNTGYQMHKDFIYTMFPLYVNKSLSTN